MDVALADSPTIEIAQARIEAAQAQAQTARSTLFPNVSFDGYINRERYTATSYIPPPFADNFVNQGYIPVNLTYDFDFWGLHRAQLAAATSQERANEASFAAARLSLSTQVASTYYQLRSYMSQLAVAQQLIAKQKTLLSIVQVRARHGVASAIPVTEVVNSLQQAEITAANQAQLITLSREQLATLMGKNPLTTTIDVKPFQFLPQQVALPQALPAHLIAIRPDVIASRWQVEARADEAKVAKARFFPDINLFAYYSYQSIGLDKLFNENSRDILVQPALSLPLFDAGFHRADLSNRYAAYDAAVGQYNQTLLTALEQVGNAATRMTTVKRQLDAQNRAVAAITHNTVLVSAQYQHGIVDYTQVLTAQTNLLNQQWSLLQLQTSQMQNAIALILALGGNNNS